MVEHVLMCFTVIKIYIAQVHKLNLSKQTQINIDMLMIFK